MKHSLSAIVLVTALLLIAPAIEAQDCSNWTVHALRGTYTFTGTAWQDMSVINPALSKGYAPVTIIGAFTINGYGDLTGWALVNAGGIPLTAEFVNSQVNDPKADCSVPMSLSMRMSEFGGAVDGPHPYVGTIAPHGPALEIDFMMLGTGPGSHVEFDHAKRISMKFDD
jgi:hypothetical protein